MIVESGTLRSISAIYCSIQISQLCCPVSDLRTEKRRVEKARTQAMDRMVSFSRDSCME